MKRIDRIIDKLERAFRPSTLEVIDVSENHQKHAAGAKKRDEEETHFEVYIKSWDFLETTIIERHRMIHYALRDEMPHIEALEIHASVP